VSFFPEIFIFFLNSKVRGKFGNFSFFSVNLNKFAIFWEQLSNF